MTTTTREQVQSVISDFIDEFDGIDGGKFTIWAVSVGAGPEEYDEYGKTKHRSKAEYRDFALHVYIKDGAHRDSIPKIYKGVPTIVFEDVWETDGHMWSGGDIKGPEGL